MAVLKIEIELALQSINIKYTNPNNFLEQSRCNVNQIFLLTLNLKLNFYYGTVKINKETI
jgi:hypothetical protein